jgi:hypothetical protein
MEMISYISFRPDRYFKDILNYVDFVILTGSIIYLSLFNASNREKDWFRVFTVLNNFFIYYRGFSYLKFFDTFTTIVSMINVIIIKIYAFLSIVCYFYFSCVLLMIALTNKSDVIAHMRDVYYWVLFGGIDDNSFEIHLSFMVIVIGTILISVVLLNILIAYLSNLFSNLEETQVLDDLREKAGFVMGIEIIIRFFRYLLTGKISLISKIENHNYNMMLSNNPNFRDYLMVFAFASLIL